MFFRANKPVDSKAVARHANDLGPMALSAMKQLLLLIALLTFPMVAAQSQTKETKSDVAQQPTLKTAVRERVVGPKASNHVDSKKARPGTSARLPTTDKPAVSSATQEPAWGNTSVIVRPEPTQRPSSNPTVSSSRPTVSVPENRVAATDRAPKKLIQPTSLATSAPVLTSRTAADSRNATSARVAAPTAIYSVGIGDVLDIRLSNLPTRESTLFTVLKNGTVEHPLLSAPVSVAGLTTDEIARLLSGQIKVIQSAKVSVSVRDYASHTVLVSGLVDSPGRKALRREAMPLYAVLSEALPRLDAVSVTITRGGKQGDPISLKNEQAMATLVVTGDVIKVSGGSDALAKQFLYLAGDVNSPGEKTFRQGMTLTQAVLAAGGTSRMARVIVKVSRRNANGFLTTNEYNLRSIEEGKAQDPLLEPGDRIEVTKTM